MPVTASGIHVVATAAERTSENSRWTLARRLRYLNASQHAPSDGDAKLETNFVEATILEEEMP
jgi:hypothetical protein